MAAKQPLAANDPDVTIPPAVKANAAKAEAAHKAAYQTPEATPPETASQTPEPAAPSKEAAAAPPAPITPPPPPTVPSPEPQNWEHLYKTWKGRYDSEMPRFKELTRTQQDRIAQLETSVADLQHAGTGSPQESFPSVDKLVTEKEIADFGPELLDLIGKKAQETLGPTITKLQRENEELKKQLRGTSRQVASTARERMYSTLNDQCPEWHQLNNDDNFLAWLQLPDRYSGDIRAELLNAANQRNDTPRVLAFFQGYLEEAATRSRATPESAVPPQSITPQAAPQVSLESLAAPGRAKTTATTPVPGDKPIITRADVTAYFARKAQGKYSSEDAARFDAMLIEAGREGRIR